MRRWLAAWLLGSPATLGGCVYPATAPTGVELSWRFVEQEEPGQEEGDEADEGTPRVRSCAGAIAEQIAFEITDEDEPRRHGVFRFDCATGYQTALELQTAASDAFVQLDPGRYAIAVLVVDDATNAHITERVQEREVEVEGGGVTTEIWQLRRAPVTWSLTLQGADACESLTMSLVYATPELDLPDHDPADEAPLYRATLRSQRELGPVLELGGQATACDAALDGLHRFDGLDRGEYLLELELDGRMCVVRVDLRGREGSSSVIDLASLPCDG